MSALKSTSDSGRNLFIFQCCPAHGPKHGRLPPTELFGLLHVSGLNSGELDWQDGEYGAPLDGAILPLDRQLGIPSTRLTRRLDHVEIAPLPRDHCFGTEMVQCGSCVA